jgi:hypothetical protein
MVIPQMDVPALRALRLVGAQTGGYHHRQRMCQPSGLRAWWMPRPVVITTGRGCASPPGLGGLGGGQTGGLRTNGREVPPSGLNPNSRISAGDPLLSGSKPGGLV